jgi:hypothetical protein
MSVIKVNTKNNKYSDFKQEEQALPVHEVVTKFIEPKSFIKKPRKQRVSTRALGTNPRAKGTNPRSKIV